MGIPSIFHSTDWWTVLRGQRYDVEVDESDHLDDAGEVPDWHVVGSKRVPPDFESLDEDEAQMEVLATRAGDVYHG